MSENITLSVRVFYVRNMYNFLIYAKFKVNLFFTYIIQTLY